MWLWAVGYIWWERQGISGRKRNPYRGMSAPKDTTPVLREAPFMLLECVGGKFMMGPEMERGRSFHKWLHPLCRRIDCIWRHHGNTENVFNCFYFYFVYLFPQFVSKLYMGGGTCLLYLCIPPTNPCSVIIGQIINFISSWPLCSQPWFVICGGFHFEILCTS